jgi:hypothetical protein
MVRNNPFADNTGHGHSNNLAYEGLERQSMVPHGGAHNNGTTAPYPDESLTDDGTHHNGLGNNHNVNHDNNNLTHNNGAGYNNGPVTRDPANKKDQTGLLTRFVPERLKHTALYRWFLRLVRVLQFLSAVISLALFSRRVYKVYRLVNTIKTRVGINHSMGAVEGILAAAVLYTILATIFQFVLRGGGPRWLRWLWVLLDLLFVGAFIAVAVLTRPNGGSAGPRQCYGNRNVGTGQTSGDNTCDLPWGTFILAIVST